MHSHIQSSRHIALFTHIAPDGDALGSTLGMAGYLHSTGKGFTLFLPTEISESLRFMVPDQFRDNIVVWSADNSAGIEKMVMDCDLVIGMDFNDPDRVGELAPLLLKSKAFKILIDHHVGPDTENFGMVFSQPSASSTCELAFRLLKEMPEINGDACNMTQITREALMTGMTTDTNNFANSATAYTFQMTSELLAAGTDRDKILQNLFFSYPQRRIDAQGYLLNRKMRIMPQGVAYMIMDARFLKRFGIVEGDTEGFVNIPLAIKDIRMSITFKKEPGTKKIRVSIRSKKGTSARSLAMKYFHGGGHEQASGGRLMLGEDIRSMAELPAYAEKCISEFFMEQ